MAYSLRGIAEVSHNPEHGEDWPAVLCLVPSEKYGFCPVLRSLNVSPHEQVNF